MLGRLHQWLHHWPAADHCPGQTSYPISLMPSSFVAISNHRHCPLALSAAVAIATANLSPNQWRGEKIEPKKEKPFVFVAGHLRVRRSCFSPAISMNGGPSGFHNAPVTRAFIIASAALSVLARIRSRADSLGLSYEDISRNLPLWRFISSAFSFSSTPEIMFGLYLLYYFRVFERQIGSNKHSVLVLFSMISTTLLEVFALAQLKDSSIKVASGPYGLIFASFVPFFFDIPVSTRFHVLSFHFSDKSFIYLAGLQLLLSSWKRSILPGICGMIAGFLYRLNVFYIRRVKFPESIGAFFSRLSMSSSGSSQSTAPDRNFMGNMRSVAGRHLEVPRNYPASAPPLVSEPPEDSISMLVSMGFDRNSARQALMQARNDVHAATNILLETQSH